MAAGSEPTGPIGWIAFVLSVLSYILTVLNLIALYGAFATTIRMAPAEIRDYLGNLRQQMCEERWALRQQGKELRAKLAAARLYHSHHHHHHRTQAHRDADYVKTAGDRVHRRRSHRRSRRTSSRGGSDDDSTRRDHGGCGSSDNTNSTDAELLRLSMSEHTLALHQQILWDLWQQFKDLERPFLVASGRRAEAMRHGDMWTEKDLAEADARADMEAYCDTGSFASWTAVYRCDFGHRFLWWRTKDDVRKVADKVSRLMMQRTEREVSHVRMMVKGIVEQGYSVGFGGGQRQGGGGGLESRAAGGTVLHHPADNGMSSVMGSSSSSNSSSDDGETQDTSSTAKAAVNAGCSEVQRESSIVSEWRGSNSQASQATAPRSPPRVVQIRSSRDGRRTEYTVRSRGGGGPGGAVSVEEQE
ncbi:hypothetical protein RB595_002140 [Gaeumannomyces hyphopodioides]